MRFDSLDAWLAWQETLHPSAIELGLERPGRVLQAMGLQSPGHAVITVAGTNGKGSSVAMLESILTTAGYRVGCYTSPHLLRYNERIRIDGKMVSDKQLCESFERIDQARGDISLTYFEFGTLAAFDIFQQAALDVAVLEVGLGGRLDAVNLLGADVALITAIDIDHSDWLGNDRESIGREKAGIMRKERVAVCSDPDCPASIVGYAAEIGARLHRLGVDFTFEKSAARWSWSGGGRTWTALPLPALRGQFQLQNAAGVLMALTALDERLPVTAEQVAEGLARARLSGRFQVIDGTVAQILDVAHNPQAARELAANLQAMPCSGVTHAVVAMLADKDIEAVINAMEHAVDHWYVASLDVPRGAPGERLGQALHDAGVSRHYRFDTVRQAHEQALQAAQPGDRIVIFGSFHTVAEAMSANL